MWYSQYSFIKTSVGIFNELLIFLIIPSDSFLFFVQDFTYPAFKTNDIRQISLIVSNLFHSEFDCFNWIVKIYRVMFSFEFFN